jgi:hypothetical protein
MAETARLWAKRELSPQVLSRTEEIAAKQMESDAWMLLTNRGEHTSANAHLWIDEHGQVHEGEFR